jgi:hypothetical protein
MPGAARGKVSCGSCLGDCKGAASATDLGVRMNGPGRGEMGGNGGGGEMVRYLFISSPRTESYRPLAPDTFSPSPFLP